ncbi:hypothetical protein PCASD_11013 [Puccinia coronata f. sp. avenae]|uniref:DNA 3'-5' helicase n=1 Tax=Puccinia coronata f. sp. avenae TaxID=200324 RepID=A0A2N5TEN7_9BASI|nr:hypothetical protein PCASD_11013 [Puccinia coronata f. sp. avenae]
MALGLGQNWTRVRSVVHMGRGDPSAICQMIGRCGRDGKPGLAILFVEKTRTNGKNSIAQFKAGNGGEQSDDDRMDALAVTPVCLRIAFAVNNLYGFIPLSTQDDAYQAEMAREKSQGFVTCRCSNCLPNEAAHLMKHMGNLSIDNFDDVVLNDHHTEGPVNEKRKKTSNRLGNEEPLTAEETKEFEKELMTTATSWISLRLGQHSFFYSDDIFGTDEMNAIIKHINHLEDEEDVRVVVGGHHFDEDPGDPLYSILTWMYECWVKDEF